MPHVALENTLQYYKAVNYYGFWDIAEMPL